MLYRIRKDDDVAHRLKQGFTSYRVDVEASISFWKLYQPPQEALQKEAWYNTKDSLDPNEINAKMKMAPAYHIVQGEIAMAVAEKHFKIKSVEMNKKHDVIIEGEYPYCEQDPNIKHP